MPPAPDRASRSGRPVLQTAGGEEIYFEETLSTFLESAGLVSIWVVRSGPADAEASVQWSVTGGSASPAGDFTPTDGVVNFAPGQTRRDIPLLILQDELVEGDETLELTLHDPVGAELGTPAHAGVTLLDDDQPHTPEADLSLFKEAEPDTAPVGQPIRFIVSLRSSGPDGSSDVVVQELIPPDTFLVDWSAPAPTTFNPANGRWTLPWLGPAEVYQLQLDLVRTNPGTVTNLAFVLQAPHPDPTLADRTNRAVAAWIAPETTDLAIGLQLATNPIALGQTVSIEMVVTNLGPRAASNITVLAPVPPGTEFVSTPRF